MYSTFQPSSAPSPESSHPEPESSRTGGEEGARAARAIDASGGKNWFGRRREARRNPETTPKSKFPSATLAAAAADAGADADGEEASRLQQPRKRLVSPPRLLLHFPVNLL